MKHIKQFFIIILISFLGEVCRSIIPLPVPASIYGLVILLVALETRILPLDAIRDTAKFLIEIMPLLFIPAAVGLMDSYVELRGILVPVLVITFLTTIFVMVGAGRTAQFVIRWERKRKNERND
ncbi:MAG: CidA/LrgA family protein [Clostridiales bacterium]|nr:CidA/LrgA family protein [Clostridiales bacterium]